MGLPPKLLGADEHEIVHTRTHAKALIRPVLALILVAAAAGAAAAVVPADARPLGQYAIAVAGALLALWWAVAPYVRWRTTTYTLTTHRLVARRGVFSKSGRDLPLNRIAEVSYQQGVVDRMFGCGSLLVQTAAEDGPLILNDVPDVAEVHRELNALLFRAGPPTRQPPAGPAERR